MLFSFINYIFSVQEEHSVSHQKYGLPSFFLSLFSALFLFSLYSPNFQFLISFATKITQTEHYQKVEMNRHPQFLFSTKSVFSNLILESLLNTLDLYLPLCQIGTPVPCGKDQNVLFL
jgi:hypothetical protein